MVRVHVQILPLHHLFMPSYIVDKIQRHPILKTPLSSRSISQHALICVSQCMNVSDHHSQLLVMACSRSGRRMRSKHVLLIAHDQLLPHNHPTPKFAPKESGAPIIRFGTAPPPEVSAVLPGVAAAELWSCVNDQRLPTVRGDLPVRSTIWHEIRQSSIHHYINFHRRCPGDFDASNYFSSPLRLTYLVISGIRPSNPAPELLKRHCSTYL
ncbi:hypothetical protein JB92DRAFT_2924630 [Gautieria morchelliformis]|nr:hypothetical protein JB92DRAFT_2924630 [Gautieria morchelliformis]